ncbi:MAG: peptidoglycan-associated lipoprotein Pal [Calditrichia bacterium]
MIHSHKLFSPQTRYVLPFVLMFALIMSCGSSKQTIEDTGPVFEPVEEETTIPIEKPVEQQEEVRPPRVEKVPMTMRTLYFGYDEATLTTDAVRILQDNAKVLKDYPDVRITVEGHCDERGTIEYNLALGDRRARSVKQFLIDLGVSSNRIATVSYGKERPADRGRSESAYSLNRRAEFVIK